MPTEYSRIQGLFKAFEWFSSTFQDIFIYIGRMNEKIYADLGQLASAADLDLHCFQKKVHDFKKVISIVQPLRVQL